MTTWNFDSTIPATNNNPSQDQPKMVQNNVSTKGILNEDHYTFESTVNGNSVDGQHKNLRFPTQNTLGAQTDPASGVYTDVDAESASPNSNLWYVNEDRIFPLSAVRACGKFSHPGSAGAITLTAAANYNGFNVDSITVNANLTVTVVLTSGAVTGDNYIFMGNTKNGSGLGSNLFPITITGTTINFGVSTGYSGYISFVVLQI